MKYVKESVSSLNEEKYTIIDPMGNQMGAGERTQVMLAAKKKGGVQSGYFVVSVKNALKAKRALEKFKGDFKNPKLKDMMSNLFYESGPKRVKSLMADTLKRLAQTGKIKLDNPERERDLFLSLFKGSDIYMKAVLNIGKKPSKKDIDDYTQSAVDLFLRR
jgi:hypothetical protein